eukprot:7381936-Prymnesium_polylepis.1
MLLSSPRRKPVGSVPPDARQPPTWKQIRSKAQHSVEPASQPWLPPRRLRSWPTPSATRASQASPQNGWGERAHGRARHTCKR